MEIRNDDENLHENNDSLKAVSKKTTTNFYRQVAMDPKRHRFHNKAALYLTTASLIMIAVLCVVYGETHHSSLSPFSSATDGETSRWLEDSATDDDDDTVRDFSDYSCRYLYAQAPRPGEKQCAFARSCNGGDGVWAAWIFCRLRWFLLLSAR